MRISCAVLGVFALSAISAMAAMPRLEFLSPRGGEVYLDGQTQEVRLNTRCKNIAVELSRDGGNTYTVLGTINAAVTADIKARNVLRWVVTAPYSGNCVIRLKTKTMNKDYVLISSGFTISSGGGIGVTTAGTTTVGVAALAPSSVTTGALADGSVTNPKLAEAAVTSNKVSSGAASTDLVLTADGIGGASWQPVGAALNFSGNLVGDVTGPQDANTVIAVGGKTSADVAFSVDVATRATSANTPNTVVKRDATGNFSAGTITANLLGAATSFTGNLAGDVTGTQAVTIVSQVGGVTAANVASGANAANAATTLNTPNTIVKRDASGKLNVDALTGTVAIANGGTGTSSAAQNAVFAGPSSGGAGAPAFRSLVAGDLPSLTGTYVDLSSNQTVGGTKTFSNSVHANAGITTGSGSLALTSSNSTVAVTGALTVSGMTTLSSGLTLSRRTVGNGGFAVNDSDCIIGVVTTFVTIIDLPITTPGRILIIKDETGEGQRFYLNPAHEGATYYNIDGVSAAFYPTSIHGAAVLYTNDGKNWFFVSQFGTWSHL